MSDEILEDFKNDLNRLQKILSFMELIQTFTTLQLPDSDGTTERDTINSIHNLSRQCHSDFLVVSGAIVLYLGGRFEYFVRERFEQASAEIASKCNKFCEMPKAMQQNLIKLTAEVMLSPRKYGHGDRGVESFVKILANNLGADQGIAAINHKCLSITTENMRPDIVRDLFKRIGLDDIWKAIGEQAAIKSYFAIAQSDAATAKAREVLNDVMELRNQIAHPSASVTWPAIPKVRSYIEFFHVIAPVLSDVVSVHESVQKDHRSAGGATEAANGPSNESPVDHHDEAISSE